MSKFCKFCGAANSDATNVCSRCGKVLKTNGTPINNSTNMNTGKPYSSVHTHTPQPKYNQKHKTVQMHHKKFPKWIYGAAGAVALIAIVIFVGSRLFLSPSESWFKENVPQEYLDYTLNDSVNTGTVSKVNIVEKTKEMGYPVFYCEVIQEEPEVEIKRYLKFHCERKITGWISNNVETYSGAVVYAADEAAQNIASEYLSELGFVSFGYSSSEVGDEGNIVTYEVNDDFKFATLSGNISVQLKYSMDESNQIFIQNKNLYHQETCHINWKMDEIVGEWLGEEEVYELFSGTYTNFHYLTCGDENGNIKLEYTRHRGYNDETSSWSGTVDLPADLTGLGNMFGVGDPALADRNISAEIEGIYNISVYVQIKLDGIEINGYNGVNQNTMNVKLEKTDEE